MSTRRSRPPRSRKSRVTEPPQGAPEATRAAEPLESLHAASGSSPTETGQLRALEAGWDELLT